MRVAFLLLAGCAAAVCQQQPPGVQVRGRVVDAVSGRPLPGALLTVVPQGKPQASVESFSDGRFLFESLPPGDHAVTVLKSGYAGVQRTLRVPAGEELHGVEIPLHRYAVISGRILDHEGNAFPGAAVRLLGREERSAGSRFHDKGPQEGSSMRSDDRGDYRIWALQPGKYVLCARPTSDMSPFRMLAASHACYPESSQAAEASAIRLEWGDVREGVDIRLGRSDDTRVQGTVLLPDGAPPQFSDLLLLWSVGGGLFPIERFTSMQGRFTLDGLPAGEYVLSATVYAGGGGWAQSPVVLERGRVTTLDLRLSGKRPLTGRLLLFDPPDDLLAREPPSQVKIELEEWPQDATQVGREGGQWIPLAGLETPFEIAAPPGPLRVAAMTDPAAGYLAEVRFGGAVRQDRLIEIPVDAAPAELVAVIRFDLGKLEGRVELPEAVKEAWSSRGGLLPEPIRVVVYDRLGGTAARGVVDMQSGLVAFDLPPGRYQAAVGSSSRQPFEIKPNETTRIDLEIEP